MFLKTADASKIIAVLQTRLNLTFVDDSQEANLCYVNSEEVRPEFKQAFSGKDIDNYITGFLHSKNLSKSNREFTPQDFPYPEDDAAFWKLVTIGQKIIRSSQST